MHLEHFFLDNGLEIYICNNNKCYISTLNILYKVGSKYDPNGKKGLAHLFEHLMFSGSKNVKNYDYELQKVGGNNNAYTNCDVTNYYCTVPYQNIETAFWIESDRMALLNVTEEKLNIQKTVVTEELFESYYSHPYSDSWLNILPLVYSNHNYKHPTIGYKEDIASVNINDINNFYNYYSPNNAVLVISGNVNSTHIYQLCEKYFGDIEQKEINFSSIENYESNENRSREKYISKEVSAEVIYLIYPMPVGKNDQLYYVGQILMTILGNGRSSILYKQLVDTKDSIFSSVSVELTETIEKGLFIISGTIKQNTTHQEALNILKIVLDDIKNDIIKEESLQKAKNILKTEYALELLNSTNVADIIANLAVIDNISEMDNYNEIIDSITLSQLNDFIHILFNNNNEFKLIYESNK